MTMKELLKMDFMEHYGILSAICVDAYVTEGRADKKFDMDDGEGVLPEGCGKLTIVNENGTFDLLHYEGLIGQCKSPKSFQKGLKRCDNVLWHKDIGGIFLLCEITSANGKRDNLEIPIKDFEGGKMQKAERQLEVSLKTLMDVPKIKEYVDRYASKVCLMAYKVLTYKEEKINDFVKPFQRFSLVEMHETEDNGAELESPSINEMGFSFRRIAHGAVFKI